MSKLKNIVIGTTIGAGVSGLVSYLSGLKAHKRRAENITIKQRHV